MHAIYSLYHWYIFSMHTYELPESTAATCATMACSCSIAYKPSPVLCARASSFPVCCLRYSLCRDSFSSLLLDVLVAKQLLADRTTDVAKLVFILASDSFHCRLGDVTKFVCTHVSRGSENVNIQGALVTVCCYVCAASSAHAHAAGEERPLCCTAHIHPFQ